MLFRPSSVFVSFSSLPARLRLSRVPDVAVLTGTIKPPRTLQEEPEAPAETDRCVGWTEVPNPWRSPTSASAPPLFPVLKLTAWKQGRELETKKKKKKTNSRGLKN